MKVINQNVEVCMYEDVYFLHPSDSPLETFEIFSSFCMIFLPPHPGAMYVCTIILRHLTGDSTLSF